MNKRQSTWESIERDLLCIKWQSLYDFGQSFGEQFLGSEQFTSTIFSQSDYKLPPGRLSINTFFCTNLTVEGIIAKLDPMDQVLLLIIAVQRYSGIRIWLSRFHIVRGYMLLIQNQVAVFRWCFPTLSKKNNICEYDVSIRTFALHVQLRLWQIHSREDSIQGIPLTNLTLIIR